MQIYIPGLVYLMYARVAPLVLPISYCYGTKLYHLEGILDFFRNVSSLLHHHHSSTKVQRDDPYNLAYNLPEHTMNPKQRKI